MVGKPDSLGFTRKTATPQPSTKPGTLPWNTEKRIQMAELFDGRLARFGVLECLVTNEKSPAIRVLTDEKSILAAYPGPDGCVKKLSSPTETKFPVELLNAIAQAFDTEIYCQHQHQFFEFATQEEWHAWLDAIASAQRDDCYREFREWAMARRTCPIREANECTSRSSCCWKNPICY
jgi:hypothetical protein